MSKTGTFHAISGLYRDFPILCFLTDFDASKKCLGSFFAFFDKSDLKTCIAALNHDFCLFDLFHLVTWDDLDLYYGHKAQQMILTDVSDTIHADSLALFALNIEILLSEVTKPKSRKFWLWPDLWRHQWPPGQLFDLVPVDHVQGYRMAFEIWKSVQ